MRLEDRFELQDLVHRYAYFVDEFQFGKWAELFTPDCVLDEREFQRGLFEGHAALLAYGEAIAGRVAHLVHLMTNQLIWEIQEDTASGTSFALLESMLKTGERTRFQVKYEDEFRRVSGRWLIHRRVLRRSFPDEGVMSALSG